MTVLSEEVNLDVFRRYAGLSLPRHVSYPMPTWWHAIDADEALAIHRDSDAQQPGYDLSLYLHIPFCESLCKFCACNKVIQHRDFAGATERTERYVRAIQREVRRLADTVDTRRPLRQIHYGGGSPTYLTVEQTERLHQTILDAFHLAPDAEVAMEVDPRTVTDDKLACLHRLGFNRLSMGVQDFQEQVQTHVRRVQPFSMVEHVVTTCRRLGIESLNFDLIYGMPYQTPESIRDTLKQVITLEPDRIAYYHYAQIPEKVATQRGMDYTKLPDSESKLDMFLIGLEMFERAGYEFVGLDHFAKPVESLVQSVKDGTVQRNFQGMTTGGGLRLLGAGVSSITHLLDVGFLQNIKDTDAYIETMERDGAVIERGKRFTCDDRVRQMVINQLYCMATIRPALVESTFDIRFTEYFARELEVMKDLEKDGLVTLDPDGTVHVTRPLGRVLVRNVAAVFDGYLDPDAYRKGEQSYFSINA